MFCPLLIAIPVQLLTLIIIHSLSSFTGEETKVQMIPRHCLLEMSWFFSPIPHQWGLCILPATALMPAACLVLWMEGPPVFLAFL